MHGTRQRWRLVVGHNPMPPVSLAASCLPPAQVPWSSLGRVPVEVKMDRLYVLVGPRPDTQRGKGVVSPVSSIPYQQQQQQQQQGEALAQTRRRF